ncbi:MAG: branched-chain amino acid ABC transporter permease [Actinobacteria bacterium]|nr:branched-chain amino acid ABC transporter permease [Actinomycetota bacterium]
MTMLTAERGPRALWRRRRGVVYMALALLMFPFVISLLVDGQGIASVWNNDLGNARFLQGLAIEVFILGLFAISYDLLLGVAGIISFGHAMFFAVGAYGFGIMLKSFELHWVIALLLVGVLAVLQALLFAILLPRVKGLTFALVTLGIAAVFWIVISSSDLAQWAGAEIGLQGVETPVWFLDTTNHRFVFYLLVAAIMLGVYVLYTKIADSPMGRVLVSVRENEDRSLMLGYNTFWFKTAALIVSSLTAALAGVLHTMHQPIVTPNVAGLTFAITVLLMVLIGGAGTISGALVGAAVYRLLNFYLDKWFGGASGLLVGLVFVLLVLYLPYGIVGTWRVKKAGIKEGRARLRRMFERALSRS